MGVSHLGFLCMIVFLSFLLFFLVFFVLSRLISSRGGSLRAVIYCMVVALGMAVSCFM